MKKIKMGTGVGVESIIIQGIKVVPDGKNVVVNLYDIKISEKLGWKLTSYTHMCLQAYMVPPKDKYKCIKYSAGDPCYDGVQIVEFESDDNSKNI